MSKYAAMLVGVALVVTSPAVARDRLKGEVPTTEAASVTTRTTTATSTPTIGTVSERQRYCIVGTPTGSHIQTKTCKTRAEWLDQDGFDPTAK